MQWSVFDGGEPEEHRNVVVGVGGILSKQAGLPAFGVTPRKI